MQYSQQPGWNQQGYPPQNPGFPPGGVSQQGGWGGPGAPQYPAGYGYPGMYHPGQAPGMYPPGMYHPGQPPHGMYPPQAPGAPGMYGGAVQVIQIFPSIIHLYFIKLYNEQIKYSYF